MRAVILSAGIGLLLLAGCGGDDDAPIEPIGTTTNGGGDSSGASVSKGDYLAGADPSCAEANSAIANLSTTTGENLTLAATQEKQITEGVLTSLEGLAAPADPDGALDRYLKALNKQVTILGEREQAASSGDTAEYETLGGELAQAKADARVAAEEFGFEDCGQEGTATAPDDATGGDSGTGGTAVPVEPAPAPAPAPEPTPEPPATGGTDAGGGTGGGGGGGDSGSSGGVSPG